jgi:hypothetical protein
MCLPLKKKSETEKLMIRMKHKHYLHIFLSFWKQSIAHFLKVKKTHGLVETTVAYLSERKQMAV